MYRYSCRNSLDSPSAFQEDPSATINLRQESNRKESIKTDLPTPTMQLDCKANSSSPSAHSGEFDREQIVDTHTKSIEYDSPILLKPNMAASTKFGFESRGKDAELSRNPSHHRTVFLENHASKPQPEGQNAFMNTTE